MSTAPITKCRPGSIRYSVWQSANRLRLVLSETGDPTGECPILEEIVGMLPDERPSSVKTYFSEWVSRHGLHEQMIRRRRKLVLAGRVANSRGQWLHLEDRAPADVLAALVRAIENTGPDPEIPAFSLPVRRDARPS